MSVSNAICIPSIPLYNAYMYFPSDKSSLETGNYLHGCHLQQSQEYDPCQPTPCSRCRYVPFYHPVDWLEMHIF